MSSDEFLCLIACGFFSFYYWSCWGRVLIGTASLSRQKNLHVAATLVPLLACALLLFVLKTSASHDVRDSLFYTSFYLIMGAAWLGLVLHASGALGLVLRDDWLERGNPAAAACGAGLILGVTAAFACANIGDGPGWWVVVFSALLSTGAMLLALALLNIGTGVIERITIGRDTPLGIRTGACMLMTGAIAGRAVAGDWVSAADTCDGFLQLAWPLLPAILALTAFEVFSKSAKPSVSLSLFVATIEFSFAAFWIAQVGPW